MAINRIAAPSSTPSSDADWAAIVAQVLALVKDKEQAVRKSATHILKGSLFSIGGVMYIADADTAITGTSSEFVKITPAGATASASFVEDLDGVAWDDAGKGYYDASMNLYIFDECKAYTASQITGIKSLATWRPSLSWAQALGVTANSAVLNNNSATVAGVDPINGNAGDFGYWDIGAGSEYTPAKGTYIISTLSTTDPNLEYITLGVKNATSTFVYSSQPFNGMLITDGVNFRLGANYGIGNTVYVAYRKIA